MPPLPQADTEIAAAASPNDVVALASGLSLSCSLSPLSLSIAGSFLPLSLSINLIVV